MEKTQAMRSLEGKRIAYEALAYPDDMRDAEEIALVLDLPPDQVFKTLVVLPPESGKKPMLVMIPADAQLDLKKLAATTGAKKLKMATHREAEELTGLQVGGISAVALLNKGFAVYIDSSALDVATICVSAGKRGLQLRVATSDLIKLTNAQAISVADHSPH
jgi:Cys-tRNA(Pro)/Cys-tRNA(Cys) deacylase